MTLANIPAKLLNWFDSNVSQRLRAKHYGTISGGHRIVQGIVLHDTAGSGSHNDTLYLANPSDGRTVSVDFTVEKSGAVYQLNPNLDTCYCYHAGRNTKFKGKNNGDVNKACIGIEISQKADIKSVADPKYPAIQVQAVASLLAYLSARFDLKVADITTHHIIIQDGSRIDPREFPFSDMWAIYGELMKIAAPVAGVVQTTPSEPLADGLYVVEKGDTLWSIAAKFKMPLEHLKAINGKNTPDNRIFPGDHLRVKD